MADIALPAAPVTWPVANQIQGATARGANGYVEFEAEAVAVFQGGLTWLPSPQRAEMINGEMVPIDLPINDPDVWNWKVTPRLGVAWPPFHVNVDEDGTNLSSAATAPGKGPVQVVQGRQGASVVGAEDQGDGTIRFILDDGTRTAPMPITQGPAGPANRIQIGTVLRGDDPYASLTGAPPNQVLNLVLPKGDPGGIAATFTETGPGEFTVDDGEDVIEVHAFAEDGTPSPGAQAALEAATPEWDNLQGRPAVFPPSAHSHGLADIDLGPSRTAIDNAITDQEAVALAFAGSSTMFGGRPTTDDHRVVNRIANYLGATMTSSTSSPSVPSSGFAVFQYSQGNTRAHNYLTAAKVDAVAAIQPQVMVHAIGSNDYYDQRDPVEYRANLQGWLDGLRARSPETVHLYVVQHGRNDLGSTTYSWRDYTEQLHILAGQDPERVEVLDLSVEFENRGVPGTDRWSLLYSDNIHLNDAGNRLLAHLLCEHFGFLVPDGRAELYWDDAPQGGDPMDVYAPILQAVVPPAPFPRVGTATATVYARNDGSGDSNLALGHLTPTREVLSRGRITENGMPHSVPMTVPVRIPAGESLTYSVWVNNGTAYISSGGGWGNLVVHVSAD